MWGKSAWYFAVVGAKWRQEPARLTKPLALADLKDAVVQALREQPVVLSAPTGTGKSTEVPRWFAGKVLVVEPRRLACRALAKRVAHLDDSPLGTTVGYRVRDEHCAGDQTRILYITPGILLQNPELTEQFETIVIDEFHERRIDIDWICADLQRRKRPFVVMSATLEGQRVATHLGGQYFEAHAKSFEVHVRYRAPTPLSAPDLRGLEERVHAAVQEAKALSGDVLVFLPGKAEIRKCAAGFTDGFWEVLELHGGLSLSAQSRAFAPTERRKLILSTNVAETSLTLPGVRCVVDSGLVRRTSYHDGRAHLAATSIAEDSSAQRKGRAGRTAPGSCLRLWGQALSLAATTPPEMHRETLHEMLLWSAAAGRDVEQLPFLDPPKPYALQAARSELQALGAVDVHGQLTDNGRKLHRLPLDARLGRLLVQAKASDLLPAMIELVALLSHQPPIALTSPEPGASAEPCDAIALLDWLHQDSLPQRERTVRQTVRQEIARLRRALGAEEFKGKVDRRALIAAVLRADPRCAYVARRKKRNLAWSAGSTELTLGRESWAQLAPDASALVVLHSIAMGAGRERRLIATRACAVPLSWLAAAGLGELRVQRPTRKGGRLMATVERVYAGQLLDSQEQEVRGASAREALVQLYLTGRLFRTALNESKARAARWELLPVLAADPRFAHLAANEYPQPSALPAWCLARLTEMEVEGGEDVELLSQADLTLPEVPAELLQTLHEEFPLTVDSGDCLYAVEYDLTKRQVLLSIVKGSRRTPPPATFLPAFRGFRVCVEAGGSLHVVRAHGRR